MIMRMNLTLYRIVCLLLTADVLRLHVWWPRDHGVYHCGEYAEKGLTTQIDFDRGQYQFCFSNHPAPTFDLTRARERFPFAIIAVFCRPPAARNPKRLGAHPAPLSQLPSGQGCTVYSAVPCTVPHTSPHSAHFVVMSQV